MTLSIADYIKDKKPVIVAKLGESLAVIVSRMVENDFSQLPVVDTENKALGVIDSDELLAIVMENSSALRDLKLDKSMLKDVQLFDQANGLMTLLEEMKGGYALVTDDDGELVQIMTDFDVIQYFRQHNEDVLTEVKSKFQDIDQQRFEFLTAMSVQLRVSLAPVIGYSDVLLEGTDGELNEQMEEDIRLIRDSGRRLLGLINNLNDVAKIEAGHMELRYEPIDLHEIIDSVLNSVRVREFLQVKDLNFRLNFDEKIGTLIADDIRVRQILHNIVENAIKFTEKGAVTLAAQDKGEYVLIQISDTGIGIEEEYLPLVFDGLGGTNLGLPVTKSLVELHGGEIWLDSVYGEGTTCFIKLPYERPK